VWRDRFWMRPDRTPFPLSSRSGSPLGWRYFTHRKRSPLRVLRCGINRGLTNRRSVGPGSTRWMADAGPGLRLWANWQHAPVSVQLRPLILWQRQRFRDRWRTRHTRVTLVDERLGRVTSIVRCQASSAPPGRTRWPTRRHWVPPEGLSAGEALAWYGRSWTHLPAGGVSHAVLSLPRVENPAPAQRPSAGHPSELYADARRP
jgi:hypothetical protein